MATRNEVIVISVIAAVFLVGLFGMGAIFLSSVWYGDDYDVTGSGQVAVVEIFGPIYDPEWPVRQLDRWREDNGIKAVVLHVNSPGGGVAASQEIYEAVQRLREDGEKIVVVSMESVAASGGYYIACAADMIVANPGTITGSIGVIMQYPTFGRLMDKIGVDYETIKSGELKDVGNMSRRMNQEEEEMLRSVIMDTYEQFVDVVSQGTEMDKKDIYPLADGRIYTGLQAYNLGLVDTLGTFHDAVQLAADLAGIDGKPETVKEIRRREGIFDVFANTMGAVRKAVTVESYASGQQILYLYR